MLRTARLICIATLFFLAFSVEAKTQTDPQLIDSQTRQVIEKTTAPSANRGFEEKNAVLEAQLQTMKDYQSALLDTVYWALGGVFSVVVLLSGFGWFANFKVYERDKANLTQELRKLVEASFQEAQSNLQETVSTSHQELLKLIREHEQATSKTIGTSNNRLANLIGKLELKFEKKRMYESKTPTIAITCSIGVLELSAKVSPHETPEIIQFIISKMEEGGQFNASEMTRIADIIDTFPPNMATLVEKLREKMLSADIFEMTRRE